jgi:hypothetical protein
MITAEHEVLLTAWTSIAVKQCVLDVKKEYVYEQPAIEYVSVL